MKRLLGIAAVVAVLGVAALMVGGAVTSAQEGDGPIATFMGKLAAKLGIGEDELKTAIEETQSEMMDEAVAEGRLTEEQAERLKERAEEGGFLFPCGGPGRGPWGGGVTPEAVAEVLGMSQDELMDALRDGQSPAEVAEAQGISVDEFTEALLSQVKVQLDSLVAEGKLTQDQADTMFQRIEENIDSIVNAQAPGPGGFGGFGGPRRGPGGFGFGGWWDGPPSDQPAESTEASGVTA